MVANQKFKVAAMECAGNTVEKNALNQVVQRKLKVAAMECAGNTVQKNAL